MALNRLPAQGNPALTAINTIATKKTSETASAWQLEVQGVQIRVSRVGRLGVNWEMGDLSACLRLLPVHACMQSQMLLNVK